MSSTSSTDAQPWLAFLASRLMLFVACYIGLQRFPAHPLEPWQTRVFPANNWLDGWVRWDSMWYESIVDSNARSLPKHFSNASFFPLYAWVAWLFSLPFRPFLSMEQAFYVGGLVVSNAAFLIGLVGVHRLATILAGREVASRTMWLICLFPFSFFFSAVYSDALYFCLAAWSFYCVQSRKWRPACGLAALAAMTRLLGFALYPALVIEYLRQHRVGVRSLRTEVASAAMLAAAPAVLGTYFWVRYGNPLEFVNARQAGWGRAAGPGAFLSDFRSFTSGSLFSCGSLEDCLRSWDVARQLAGYWYIALIPICVLLALYVARTLGPGLCVWVVLSVLMALPNGLDGTGRFSAVLFPVFIAFALVVRSRALSVAACAFCVPFLLLFLFQFSRWRPIL